MNAKGIITSGLTVLMTISMLILAMLPSVVLAEVYDAPEPQKIYSPYVERTQSDANFAEGAYFGDTHLPPSYLKVIDSPESQQVYAELGAFLLK